MSMTQLVVGAALGYIVAQGLLNGIRYLAGWLAHARLRAWLAGLRPPGGSTIIGGLIRHAWLVGAGVALITLGVWAVEDYRAGRLARGAAALETGAATDAHGSAAEVVSLIPPPKLETVTAPDAGEVDPYADPDFKVRRGAHAGGTAVSLKERLLRRSEAKARADLLLETRQHLRRSQYDCEAADRAAKYVKADLDVWGFARWQAKYFPIAGYQGAALAQCRDIKELVDRSWLDLQATVARQDHP